MPRGVSRLRQAEKQTTLVLDSRTQSALVADANDYDLTVGACFNIGATGADRSITGIAGGVEGRVIQLVNTLGQNIFLVNESSSSLAQNRILTALASGASFKLSPNNSVFLSYNNVIGRWVICRGQDAFDPVTDTNLTSIVRGQGVRTHGSSLVRSFLGAGLSVAFGVFTSGDVTKQSFAEVAISTVNFTMAKSGNVFVVALGELDTAPGINRLTSQFGVAFDGAASKQLNIYDVNNGAGDDHTYNVAQLAIWAQSLSSGSHTAKISWGTGTGVAQNVALMANVNTPLIIAVFYPS